MRLSQELKRSGLSVKQLPLTHVMLSLQDEPSRYPLLQAQAIAMQAALIDFCGGAINTGRDMNYDVRMVYMERGLSAWLQQEFEGYVRRFKSRTTDVTEESVANDPSVADENVDTKIDEQLDSMAASIMGGDASEVMKGVHTQLNQNPYGERQTFDQLAEKNVRILEALRKTSEGTFLNCGEEGPETVLIKARAVAVAAAYGQLIRMALNVDNGAVRENGAEEDTYEFWGHQKRDLQPSQILAMAGFDMSNVTRFPKDENAVAKREAAHAIFERANKASLYDKTGGVFSDVAESLLAVMRSRVAHSSNKAMRTGEAGKAFGAVLIRAVPCHRLAELMTNNLASLRDDWRVSAPCFRVMQAAVGVGFLRHLELLEERLSTKSARDDLHEVLQKQVRGLEFTNSFACTAIKDAPVYPGAVKAALALFGGQTDTDLISTVSSILDTLTPEDWKDWTKVNELKTVRSVPVSELLSSMGWMTTSLTDWNTRAMTVADADNSISDMGVETGARQFNFAARRPFLRLERADTDATGVEMEVTYQGSDDGEDIAGVIVHRANPFDNALVKAQTVEQSKKIYGTMLDELSAGFVALRMQGVPYTTLINHKMSESILHMLERVDSLYEERARVPTYLLPLMLMHTTRSGHLAFPVPQHRSVQPDEEILSSYFDLTMRFVKLDSLKDALITEDTLTENGATRYAYALLDSGPYATTCEEVSAICEDYAAMLDPAHVDNVLKSVSTLGEFLVHTMDDLDECSPLQGTKPVVNDEYFKLVEQRIMANLLPQSVKRETVMPTTMDTLSYRRLLTAPAKPDLHAYPHPIFGRRVRNVFHELLVGHPAVDSVRKMREVRELVRDAIIACANATQSRMVGSNVKGIRLALITLAMLKDKPQFEQNVRRYGLTNGALGNFAARLIVAELFGEGFACRVADSDKLLPGGAYDTTVAKSKPVKDEAMRKELTQFISFYSTLATYITEVVMKDESIFARVLADGEMAMSTIAETRVQPNEVVFVGKVNDEVVRRIAEGEKASTEGNKDEGTTE